MQSLTGLSEVKRSMQRLISVADLFAKLQEIHRDYSANIFPNLQDSFTLDIFNSYRSALYPQAFPRRLTLNSDPRGTLFEVAKGGGGGQFFSSWTKPELYVEIIFISAK